MRRAKPPSLRPDFLMDPGSQEIQVRRRGNREEIQRLVIETEASLIFPETIEEVAA